MAAVDNVVHAAQGADDPEEQDGFIGDKLRVLRKEQGLSLTALSEKTGVSIGAISQIERGTSSPSIRTLRSLTNALGVSIGDLFSRDGPPRPQSPDFIVRRDDRKKLKFWRTGISKELLSDLEKIDIELLMLTIEPDGSTGDAYTHRGEEAGLVLEGQLELTVDGETTMLEAGDAFGFRSDRPHSFGNKSKAVARVLWINTGNHKDL